MRRKSSGGRTSKSPSSSAPTSKGRRTPIPIRRNPPPASAALLAQLPTSLPQSLLQDASQNAQFAQSLIIMRRWANSVCQLGIEGLRREFRQIRVPVESHVAFDRNMRRCRYKGQRTIRFQFIDVFCADRSRVVLRVPAGEDDFIHANWVTGQQLQNAFICAQGPLPHTSRDFWLMIWQERVHHVFMLCRTVEMNRPKCAQYWPTTPGESIYYGNLMVRNDGVQLSKCGNIVATALSLSAGTEARRIFHRQWATWPDRFIPRHVEPAMRLLELSRACPCNPTVVHCSAGIGRTGTLVAIEFLLRSLHLGVEPNVPSIVKHIRTQRSQAVQTEDQYVYVHYAVLQRIAQFGALMHEESAAFFTDYADFMQAIGSDPPVPLPAYVEPRPRPQQAVRASRRRSVRRRGSESRDSNEKTPEQKPQQPNRTVDSKQYSGTAPRKPKTQTEETVEQLLVARTPISQVNQTENSQDPPSTVTATPDLENAHQPTTYFDGRRIPADAARQQQSEITDSSAMTPTRPVNPVQIDSVTHEVRSERGVPARVVQSTTTTQKSTDSDESPVSVFLQPNMAQYAERTPFAMNTRRPQPPLSNSSSRSPSHDDDEGKPGEERYFYNRKKYANGAEYTVDKDEKK
ncbi:hypothetical protein M3Y98_00661500 [Aphelenchoides besseyi]|nr:hypothetical protein M3Y98_00661500 [Aphelenchoides besseyi]KAI6208800.1 hypothetical protein M3Y96_00153600 [Aphelenchoides besseyi]